MFNSETSINRRLSTLLIFTLLITGVFTWRLTEWQIVHAETLQTEAASKREIGTILYGKRGNILDRNGLILAESVTRYHLTAAPVNVRDYRSQGQTITIQQVAQHISETLLIDYETIFDALTGNPKSQHVYLAKNLTLEQLNNATQLRTPWLYSEKVETRNYPNNTVAANLIGFMGTDEALAGLELKYDDCLKGENGRQIFERSADGVRVPGSTVVLQEPTIGETIELTIDADLQWFTQTVIQEHGTKLQAEWAHAVIVDSATGEILTAAEWPTLNANTPTEAPMNHRGSKIFSSPYEPGSTIKTLSYVVFLEQKIMNSTDQMVIPPFYQVTPRHRITDAFDHDYLQYTPAGVLVYSSNIGMSILGERVSREDVFKQYLQFGLGARTNIGFPGESAGKIFTPQEADIITEKTQLFGQGMTVTSIQIAGAYQAVANQGIKKPLHLVKGCGENETLQEGVRIMSEKTAIETMEVLEEVVQQGLLAPTVKKEGYRIAAKTGTAEVAIGGEYTRERVISIAGAVKSDTTQYVVLVVFGKPQTSRFSSAAAPAFNEITSYIINKYDVPQLDDPVQFDLKW